MCGIGFILGQYPAAQPIVESCLKSLRRRGPDASSEMVVPVEVSFHGNRQNKPFPHNTLIIKDSSSTACIHPNSNKISEHPPNQGEYDW